MEIKASGATNNLGGATEATNQSEATQSLNVPQGIAAEKSSFEILRSQPSFLEEQQKYIQERSPGTTNGQPQSLMQTQVQLASSGIINKPATATSYEAIKNQGIHQLSEITGKTTAEVESAFVKHGLNLANLKDLSKSDLVALRDELSGKKDSISEMSQQDMLYMQRFMEQRAQLEQMISNVLKKAGASQDDIVQQLKSS